MRQNTANYDLQVDTENVYQMRLGEAVNVIIKEGGSDKIYYNTKQNWDNNPGLIAEREALYIYYDKTYITNEHGERIAVPGIKVGDGTSYLFNMPFVGDEEVVELAMHINDPVAHVTVEDRIRWDNKVTGFLSPDDSEMLVLSKN